MILTSFSSYLKSELSIITHTKISKMATSRPGRRPTEGGNPISYVQMDGLVVMKMVKHCHEESAGTYKLAQGALLGLVVENRLEITNCFGFPKNCDESVNEEEYQLAYMRRLRRVNVDHFHVGWYQCADVGNFISLSLLESQVHYQTSIEEAVVVIYDSAKTSRGFLSIKAYRLTPQALKLYIENEFTPEAVRNLKVSFENLFVEVPIVIKSSLLTNILLTELDEMIPEDEGTKYLDLGTASVLENHLRSMMDRMDKLNQEAAIFNRYQQMVVRLQQDKQRFLIKRQQENAARAAKGEPPLPEEDLSKQFRPIVVPSRMTPMILGGQIATYSQHISQFCSQSLAKLFITQSLQAAKDSVKK